MGKKGKRFLDKRRDVLHTFKVVSRSQRDPLVADPSAPQAVLQPTEGDASEKSEQEKYGIFFDDDYNYLQHLRGVREAVNWDDEDLEVYTIRCEDPQAGKKELRGKKLLLPSSAFESFVEEPIGLLNKAAPVTGPRPELDPDVVAGLDDDDIFNDNAALGPDDDDALPDNFVMMLNANEPPDGDDGEWEDYEEEEEDEEGEGEDDGEMPALEGDEDGLQTSRIHVYDLPTSSLAKLSAYREKAQDEGYDADEEERDFSSDFNDSDDEGRDVLASLGGPFDSSFHHSPSRGFEEEDTKSHFTNYSLTSSVLPRKDLLTTLDDCFEEKFVREYGEEQVGALDGEDIEGFVGEESPLFRQALLHSKKKLQDDTLEDQDRIIKWIKDMQDRRGSQEDEEKEEVELWDGADHPKERWDCESILTLNSTLYNHPRTITDPPRRKKIAVDPRTGVPLNNPEEYGLSGLTRRNLAHHDKANDGSGEGEAQPDTQTLITSMSAISIRPPGETSAERRCRKKALKELRRERRIEKKLNRAAFKDEKKRQEKILMNNRYNNKISLV
ncbi:protein LTV1 homolog [Eriocheir sinensis]|uniref:protein LTV1 homolog n=1 Tax=Eriocheir sinensis TaxID=95602 RepID=UPI0021C5F34A|nr:protein LTV1 homolog [Eriocheir sinensis]XP_050717592.1 protein LTV1 homolog [Eriocheir sinensis]